MIDRYEFHANPFDAFQVGGQTLTYEVVRARILKKAKEVKESNVLFASRNQVLTYSLMYFIVLMNNLQSGNWMAVKKGRTRQPKNAPIDSTEEDLPEDLPESSQPSSIVELCLSCDSLFANINDKRQYSIQAALFFRALMVSVIVSI
jgi:hypothetical protein